MHSKKSATKKDAALAIRESQKLDRAQDKRFQSRTSHGRQRSLSLKQVRDGASLPAGGLAILEFLRLPAFPRARPPILISTSPEAVSEQQSLSKLDSADPIVSVLLISERAESALQRRRCPGPCTRPPVQPAIPNPVSGSSSRYWSNSLCALSPDMSCGYELRIQPA
jgi:hypothetical protein